MSDLINPQDIPEDFIGIAEELFEEGHWSNNTKINVARFLNAAIEAGLVVPASEAKVLRRALEIMHSDFASNDSQSIDGYIQEAKEDVENKFRREMESEDASDQAK